MDLNQLAEKIDKRLDRIDDKLDSYNQRVTRVEERYNSISGQVKIIFTLIGAVITGIISWITSQFK